MRFIFLLVFGFGIQSVVPNIAQATTITIEVTGTLDYFAPDLGFYTPHTDGDGDPIFEIDPTGAHMDGSIFRESVQSTSGRMVIAESQRMRDNDYIGATNLFISECSGILSYTCGKSIAPFFRPTSNTPFRIAQGMEFHFTGADYELGTLSPTLHTFAADLDECWTNAIGYFCNGGGLSLQFTITSFTMTIQQTPDLAPVPGPLPAVLLLSGLGGFALLRRRRSLTISS